MIGLFLVPYERWADGPTDPHVRRRPLHLRPEIAALIRADGGAAYADECLGNYAVVKVRATAATLQALNDLAGVRRLPKDRLDDALDTLTQQQKITLRDWIEALGYPRAEWQSVLGTDLGAITLRQVLRFILTRRLRPRYDPAADAIVLDGAVQPCGAIEDIDAAVTDG